MDKLPTSNADRESLKLACLVGLTVIVTVTALKLGQAIIAPVVLGLVLGIVVGPIVRNLDELGAHPVCGAIAGLVLTLILITMIALWVWPIMFDLISALPRVSERMLEWIEEMVAAVRGLEALEQQLNAPGEDGVETVVMPTVVSALWLAPNVAAQALIAMGTLFFFLLVRNELYTALGETTSCHLAQADRAVSHYFLTITSVNLGLGVAVSGVLTIVGISDPVVWGAAAFVLNFVLYLGPAIMVVSLLIAGMMQFSGGYVLLPPLAFLLLNMLEAQFVTPAFVGQRLALNPLAVFLAIVFGLWLWGPIGGVLALPILVWVWVVSGNSNVNQRLDKPVHT